MSFSEQVKIQSADSPSIDAFSRLRVSNPVTLFDSTFLYDKQPLVFEEDITGGASATHVPNNSAVTLTTSGTGVEEAVLQAYRRARYRPGKSHLVAISFKFGPEVAGVTKEVGINDDLNGILLQQSGSVLSIIVRSSSDTPTESVAQADWNIDKLDGTGPSGITLDITKPHIFYMDMQWLGVGRVRVGFDINGLIVYVHEFNHANENEYVYMRNLIQPIRYRVSSVDAVGTMDAICSTVQSEGGAEDRFGFMFSQSVFERPATLNTRTHIVSIRPKALFNGELNTNEFTARALELFAIADQPIFWELVVGATLTGSVWTDVNSNFSSSEYDMTGTFDNLDNGIVISSGFLSGSAKEGITISRDASVLYPLTTDRAGNNREMGTLTLLAQSIGTTVGEIDASMSWTELR